MNLDCRVVLLFLGLASQGYAGGIRDGGDEPIIDPSWDCSALSDSGNQVQVKIGIHGDEIQVVATRNFVFEDIYRPRLAPTMLTDGQGSPLGIVMQHIQYENGRLVFALSIYPEEEIEDMRDGISRFYRASLSVKWEDMNFYAFDLKCLRRAFSAQEDRVYSAIFRKDT